MLDKQDDDKIILPNIHKDLQPIAEAANSALQPAASQVWGYERIEKYIIAELATIFKGKCLEDITAPELYLAGPLLESLRYTGYKDSLRAMYLHLLATSMDRDTASKAHPAFVGVIRQLSPDEAVLLSYFPTIISFPEIGKVWVESPLLRHVVYKDLTAQFKHTCIKASVQHTDLSMSYLDNLIRLNLVNFRQEIGKYGMDSGSHEMLEVRLGHHEYLDVTNFGMQFIEACIGDM